MNNPVLTADPAVSLPSQARLAAIWNDILAWFEHHYVDLLIALGAAILVYLLLHGLRRIGNRLAARTEDEVGFRTILGQALGKTKHWFMIVVAIKIVSVYAATPPSLYGTISFLFTVAIVLQVAIWAREIVLGMVLHKAQTDEHSADTLGTAMTLIRIAVTVGVFAIALIVVLDNLDVDVTGLVAGLGIGGIAIGLAAQGIFEELFAALSIIFDKPFKKGDAIHYDGTYGTVEKIGLKTTRIRSVTGEERIISNTNLLDMEISNNTRLERRRGSFSIGVIYQTPADIAARIPEILQEVVEGAGYGFVRAGFTGFGDSSLDYIVQFDVMSTDYDDFIIGQHRVGVAILKRFNEEGLEFAYPTQTTFTSAPDGTMIMPYPEGGWGPPAEE
ncbi:MAG: mechanosensitive ion channel family protein [Parasphingopyxis sp.]|nr:mechanosensitive ion channel family protein [Sphingomonadales bacterium]